MMPPSILHFSPSHLDQLCMRAQTVLRTIWGGRPSGPAFSHAQHAHDAGADQKLSAPERAHAAGLMRVNHVGEVCAQALYNSQSWMSQDPVRKAMLEQAAQEEVLHLDWTEARLAQLGSRPSVLNPLWYAGAFAFGTLAGCLGDRVSLGFVIETERQVEQHLASHLQADAGGLPPHDLRSREIVQQMKQDEARHAASASEAGGVALPAPAQALMRAAAKVMTQTAYWL